MPHHTRDNSLLQIIALTSEVSTTGARFRVLLRSPPPTPAHVIKDTGPSLIPCRSYTQAQTCLSEVPLQVTIKSKKACQITIKSKEAYKVTIKQTFCHCHCPSKAPTKHCSNYVLVVCKKQMWPR